MHYSFLCRKSAKDQVVDGEKSPSCDGLKVSTATKKLLTPFTPLLRWLRVTRLIHEPRPYGPSLRDVQICSRQICRSPQSHSYLCSWGFAPLPPCRNAKFVGFLRYC
ncbi:hypothetical protein GBC03_05175 [Citrobacter telavivensis]|uniref:Uncharacterized protein n=1 Tax=Citrobacter telavivensis TaxID=2653932 RepID=A0A6L5EBK6_9ENTR|nr:hypothetical protein [Citrobacter telavivensis]QFS69638.1 hypothetical protein GBC03_05175 [Citrobacter telavivensis]